MDTNITSLASIQNIINFMKDSMEAQETVSISMTKRPTITVFQGH